MKTHKLAASEAGQRLDLVVMRWLGVNRSQAGRLIRDGWIKVSAQTVKAGYVTNNDDKLSYDPPLNSVATIKPKVVYEDGAIVVIDKPAGLIVHPASAHRAGPSVVDFARTKTTDSDKYRPGIVHRLDRDTSGLLIIAKTAAAKAQLQQDFKSRRVHKQYLVLVEGSLQPARADINLPIGAGRGVRRQIDPAGRSATTSYQVEKRFSGQTLVTAEPKSGRTHQIRVHFAAIGHPVVGDKLYGHPDAKLERQFLHAARLEFKSPAGGWVDVTSSLPVELKDYLQSLD